MSQHALEIITINGRASIQDLGRLNAQHLGFSAGGAADEFAFLSANKLISDKQSAKHQQNSHQMANKQYGCAAIEITLGQISFKANATCLIAITGADCQAQINSIEVNNWQCYQLQAGDILEFSMPKTGLHSYLAILGGFTCQIAQHPWLESFSQTSNEMALGFTGEPLTVGSKLYFPVQTTPCALVEPVQKRANSPQKKPILFYAREALTLRIMPSRLFLQMSRVQQQRFLAAEYVISPDSNRMGYRLGVQYSPASTTNEKILSQPLRSQCLLSMPVTYGMVQLPENEQPIVLMKERQTMGGYPVLGTVMQTDLFRLCQMRPGEKVNFSVISYQQAQQQLQAFYQKLLP